uniref:hypothetical protein n=1 Tax=Amycolatopsis sp. CA-082387 TaxID=3239918 RepID=UPI003F497CE9
MGVDQRGRADDLARHAEVDSEGAVARIMDAVRATDPLARAHSATLTHRGEGGACQPNEYDVRAVALTVDDVPLLLEELQAHIHRAEQGDASAARRVAELLELMNRDEDAAGWWRRAGSLGDAAAVAYVKYILD